MQTMMSRGLPLWLAGLCLARAAFAAVTTSGVVWPEELPEDSSDPNARSVGLLVIGNGSSGTVSISEVGTYRKLNVWQALHLNKGTLNVFQSDPESPLIGTLFTPGYTGGGTPGVFLGGAGNPEVVVNLSGGYWDAPADTFSAGYGGEALIEVSNDGLLNRSYLGSGGGEIMLNLGVIHPVGGTRGHGTLRILDGQVTGNVVVGAGGDGVLEVGASGVLGSNVTAEADFLTVGSGPGAIGTATFVAGSTANNAYWTIGSDGGTGTVNVTGAVTTQPDSLAVILGRNLGTGTLNIVSGTLEVHNLGLTYGSDPGQGGDSTLNLNGSGLTVRNSMYSATSGSSTTTMSGNSTLTTLDSVYLGFTQSSVEMTLDHSAWIATGVVETASGGGQADITLQDGAIWHHDPAAGGDDYLITSGGDSGAGSGNSETTVTLSGDAEWRLNVPAYLSDRGRTAVTLNDTSAWTATENVSLFRLGADFTDLVLNDASTCWWQRDVTTVGSGDFNVTLNGGTFILGNDEHAGAFDVAWIDSFTAGTLDVRGGGTVSGTLPPLGAGMHVLTGPLNSDRLPALEGGTLTMGELTVDDQGSEAWMHVPSGGGSGLTYDQLSLRYGGHLVTTTPFYAGGVDFSWEGGHLESRDTLTMDTRSFGAYTDAYIIGEGFQLTLRGSDALADLSDAVLAVLGNPYSMGVFGVVTLDAGASLTTAATDVRYGAEVEVLDGATWTCEDDVFVAGKMMKYSQVTVSGGEWISRAGVLLGDMMDTGTGIVAINPGGVWRAENGYIIESGFGQVYLSGGTLVYGLNEEGRRLDFDPFTQLTSFSSGTLIVYGSILGDIELLPGATLTASHVDGNVVNGGLFLPGHSPSASLIEGDYTHDQGATLEMEIYGPTAGLEHDTLEVRGSTTIHGGTLAIRLGNYSPALNQIFALFDWTWAPGDGTFETVVFVDRDGYAATLDYETGDLTITEVGVQIDPDPVTIGSVTAGTDGEMSLIFDGKSGKSYTLQFSTNLLTASEPPPVGWQAVSNVVSEGASVSIGHVADTPVGFYRIVSP